MTKMGCIYGWQGFIFTQLSENFGIAISRKQWLVSKLSSQMLIFGKKLKRVMEDGYLTNYQIAIKETLGGVV
jgi:hypothetical protein